MGRALLELHSSLMCVSVCEQNHTHIYGYNTQCKALLRSYPGSEKKSPILREQILPLHVPLIRIDSGHRGDDVTGVRGV